MPSTIAIPDDVRERLEELAGKLGLTKTSTIRLLVYSAEVEEGEEPVVVFRGWAPGRWRWSHTQPTGGC